MPANLKVAVEKIYCLRDQLDRGKLLPIDEPTAAMTFLRTTLENVGKPPAPGMMSALALLCSRQPTLFEPLVRIFLELVVHRGVRNSDEVAALAHSVLRKPRPTIHLDDLARVWLAQEFRLLADKVQHLIDEIVVAIPAPQPIDPDAT